MSRWIDAEWIRNVYADFEHYDNRDDWTTPISNVLAVIDDAPSIEIIRCGECKYNPNGIGWVSCPMTGANTRKPDDFCSYGEREGE